jgi:hypothetical protein
MILRHGAALADSAIPKDAYVGQVTELTLKRLEQFRFATTHNNTLLRGGRCAKDYTAHPERSASPPAADQPLQERVTRTRRVERPEG